MCVCVCVCVCGYVFVSFCACDFLVPLYVYFCARIYLRVSLCGLISC